MEYSWKRSAAILSTMFGASFGRDMTGFVAVELAGQAAHDCVTWSFASLLRGICQQIKFAYILLLCPLWHLDNGKLR